MEIIGHRGAAGLAPGNTRASFKAAILAGVDWIEFDVRTTADGRVVLLHDRHTLRISPKPRLVSRSTYAELKNLKTYSGNPILTVAEAFNAIGSQAKINVHIKTIGSAQAVVHNIERMVKRGASYERFMVSSFWIKHLRAVHRLNSKVPLCLLHATRPYRFLKLRGLRVQAVGFYHRRLPDEAIHQAQLRELMIYAYTVNNPKRARELHARGIKAIVTDRPDRLKSLDV